MSPQSRRQPSERPLGRTSRVATLDVLFESPVLVARRQVAGRQIARQKQQRFHIFSLRVVPDADADVDAFFYQVMHASHANPTPPLIVIYITL